MPEEPALADDAFPTFMHRATVDLRLVLFNEYLESRDGVDTVRETWIEHNREHEVAIVETEWRCVDGAWRFTKRPSPLFANDQGGDEGAVASKEKDVKDCWEDDCSDEEEEEEDVASVWHSYSGDFARVYDEFTSMVKPGTEEPFWSFVHEHAAAQVAKSSFRFYDRGIDEEAMDPQRLMHQRVATFMFAATICFSALHISSPSRADRLFGGYLGRLKGYCDTVYGNAARA